MEHMKKTSSPMEPELTFEELQLKDYSNVASIVPWQTAIQICDFSLKLKDNSVKGVDVLSFWLRKQLRVSKHVHNVDWHKIFNSLNEWLKTLQQTLIAPTNADVCKDLSKLLADALEFAAWVRAELVETNDETLYSISIFLLAVVNCAVEFDNKLETTTTECKELIQIAVKVLSVVLLLLEDIIRKSQTIQNDCLTNATQLLVRVAELLSIKGTHLPTCLKTSKLLTFMCTHNMKLGLANNSSKWLQDTLFHLCDTVLNELETVYTYNSQTVPLARMEQFLKITQAYMMMLLNLFRLGLPYLDSSVSKSVVEILSGGESKPSQGLLPEIAVLLDKYVQPHAKQLFEIVYKLEDFQKNFIAYINEPDNADRDFNELCFDFLIVLINDDAAVTPATWKTVQVIYDYLLHDEHNYYDNKLYDQLIETYGSLLYVTESVCLYNYFISQLFQTDAMKSQASEDVLILCFSLNMANQSWSNTNCLQAFNYWINCKKSYAKFSCRISQLHVQRLLKYFQSNNAALRLDDKESCIEICLQLRPISDVFLRQTQNYYKMIDLMDRLCCYDLTNTTDWLSRLYGKVSILLAIVEPHMVFVDVFFKLVRKSSLNTRIFMLQNLKPTAAFESWHYCKFIHECSGSKDERLRSLTMRLTTKDNHMNWLLKLMHVAGSDAAAAKLSNFCDELNYKRRLYHYCNKRRLYNLKRKREDNDAKSMVAELYQISKKLNDSMLDAADIDKLKSVINNLTLLMQ